MTRPYMKPGMTPEEIDDLYGSVRDAERFAESRKPPKSTAEEIGQEVTDALGVAAGAAGYGFVAGLTGSSSIGPVPLGLAGAGAYCVAALLGYVPKKGQRHMSNAIMKGGLASAATLWALGHGGLMREAQQKAAPPPPDRAAGLPAELPPPNPQAAAVFAGAKFSPESASAALPGKPPIGFHLTEAELQALMQKRRGIR